MQEPKLPKLKAIKLNIHTGKLMVHSSENNIVQFDPKFFEFHHKTEKFTLTKGLRQHLFVKNAFTPYRSTHSITLTGNKKNDVVTDLIALHKYSQQYQEYIANSELKLSEKQINRITGWFKLKLMGDSKAPYIFEREAILSDGVSERSVTYRLTINGYQKYTANTGGKKIHLDEETVSMLNSVIREGL